MNILYIDSRMGISGIKLLSALVDMMEQPDMFIRQFNELNFDGIKAELRKASEGAVSGSRVEFIQPDYHNHDEDDTEKGSAGGFFSFGKSSKTSDQGKHHRTMDRTFDDVRKIIEDLPLSGKVRKRAVSVYETIAKAASKSHNKPINEVMLHRASPRDVIASVVGVCMMLEDMQPERIICSPITVGIGYITASRGKVPVPTPTVKLILGEIPFSGGREEGELCTLEGAAILKEYVDEFMDMPELAILRSGAGIGIRTFQNGVNCVKVHVGTEIKTAVNSTHTVLEATLINDSNETLKYAGERLEAVGVMEMFILPVTNLLGGSGMLLKCVCQNDDADAAGREILKNTSARTVRRTVVSAYSTEVRRETINTSLGQVELELLSGYGVTKKVLPDHDMERVAKENEISIREAYEMIIKEI